MELCRHDRAQLIELAAQSPALVGRALVDWVADLRMVMVVVSGAQPKLGGHGGAVWHAERLCARLLTDHGYHHGAHTVITPELLTRWTDRAADRDTVLRALTDEFASIMRALDAVSGQPTLTRIAVSHEWSAYWHAERAHTALLTQVSGDAGDGRRLHELWRSSGEDTAHLLATLAELKRAESVIVTVAADGATATVRMPGGTRYHVTCGGREGTPLSMSVTDANGDPVRDVDSYDHAGRVLVEHCGLDHYTAVLVEHEGSAAGARA